ncbi:MAG: hypothetical protein JW771_08025 [Candidatus Thermoplasmatota archaeon]|nr:hypothetical protein [Candidatus Thermoplasmatota archaeon]
MTLTSEEWMGKIQRFPVGFPPAIREIIKEQVGELGNSEAEVVKNMVLIYLTERGLLKTFRPPKDKEGRRR